MALQVCGIHGLERCQWCDEDDAPWVSPGHVIGVDFAITKDVTGYVVMCLKHGLSVEPDSVCEGCLKETT